MDFGSQLRGLERSLDALSLRQEIRANNIANINTPGFQRQDVEFEDALLDAMKQGGETLETWTPTIVSQGGPQRVDGNTNSLETEMAGLTKNVNTYQTAVQLVAMEYRTLKTVIDQR